MLLTVGPLLFAVVSATAPFPNATTSSPSSTSSSQNGLAATTAAPQFNNIWGFLSPYYLIVANNIGTYDINSIYSCAAIWSSSLTKWQGTVALTTSSLVSPTTYVTTLLPWVSEQGPSTKTFNDSLSTWTSTIPSFITTFVPEPTTVIVKDPVYYAPNYFDFKASAPCCEGCQLSGGSVQVYYWPTTETQDPQVSTLVNSAGFTFVSPSIYVAFQSLQAADLCGPVGPMYSATTLAFAPGELSTSIGYFVSSHAWGVALGDSGITWTQANFADQPVCTDKLNLFYNIGGMAYTDIGAASSVASLLLSKFPTSGIEASDFITSHTFTYNPCNPTLSVPSQILTLNSLWNTCEPPFTAFFDPPYKLSTGNGLVAFAPSTSVASPGPTPEPVLASPTVSRAPVPDTSSTPPAVHPSSSPNANPSASSIAAGASPHTPSADPDPSSSTSTEIQKVQVVTIDSSTFTLSSASPVEVASDPAGNGPGATVPAPSNSGPGSDPGATVPVPGNSGSGSDPGATVPAAPRKSGSKNVPGATVPADGKSGSGSDPAATGPVNGNSGSGSDPAATGPANGSSGSGSDPAATGPANGGSGSGSDPAATGPANGDSGSGSDPAATGPANGGASSGSGPGATGPANGGSGSGIASSVAGIEYTVSSQTNLTPGGPSSTVAGTVVGPLSGATSALAGTNTVAPGATTSPVTSIGGIVVSVGGFATDSNTSTASLSATDTVDSNGTVYTGGAAGTASTNNTWRLGLLLGLGLLCICWL